MIRLRRGTLIALFFLLLEACAAAELSNTILRVPGKRDLTSKLDSRACFVYVYMWLVATMSNGISALSTIDNVLFVEHASSKTDEILIKYKVMILLLFMFTVVLCFYFAS